MTISSCQYLSLSRQLTIKYSFTNGQDRTSPIIIQVQGFRNPVKPASQGGFFLSSLDSNNNTIGVSQEVFLSGITVPQQLGFATVGFDGTAAIGKYSNLKLNIGTSQSLGPNCFIKVMFPPEFTVDNTLTAIDGTGFFTGVSIVSIAQTNRIVTLTGCTSVYGSSPQQGSLTFRQIQNPTFVTDTGSFQVFMGVDTSFSSETLIAVQSTGIIVPKNFFTPGPISNIQISPQDATYGAFTSYNFNFTPNSNLRSTTGTQITIDFPPSLKFTQNYCAITAKSDNISQSATCSLLGNQVLLNYVFSNKPTYIGGTQIYLQIFGIKNPTSQFNLGDFKISTYMQVNSVFQLVDQGTNNNPVTAAAGVVIKTREITSTSVIANDQNVTYTFSMKFTNTIPIGGQIKVSFDSSTSVSNYNLLNNSCYRLDFSNKPTSLSCQSAMKTIIITVNTPAFSANGLIAGDEFRLQVAPINNRRDILSDSSFLIQSFDTQGNQIDKSSDPSNFTLRMTQISKFGEMQVSFENQINGAVNSTYTFNFASSLQIDQNNIISIQFPKQIGLQTTGQISCSGDPRLIKSLICYQTSSDTIVVAMNQLYTSIMPGDAFFVKIPQIRNPYSNAPTDPFGSVSLLDSQNRIIATGLNNPVTIQTTIVSQIQSSSLSQSNKDPGMLAVYTLTFQTNNPIPSGAVIQVTTPTAVSFYQDSSGCSVTTTSMKSNVCRFVDSSVLQIRNVFSGQTSDYKGQISISFSAYNPPDNRQATISLQLFIFTDTSFTYQIDQIFGGLNPNTKCTYPCLTCDAATPENCTSCPVGNSDPQFLQTNTNGTKTCKYSCDSGFTFDKSINKNCLACDKSCLTCRNGGYVDDSKSCLSCAPSYPYFWAEFATCFDSKTKCPVGSYEYAKKQCSSCPKECFSCNSPFDCTTCDPKSPTPLRQSGQCVNKCMSGRTPVFNNGYNECLTCDPSCLECQEGKPTYCKTCRTDKPTFFFGSACLSSCPSGTIENIAKMSCIGCPSGCSKCDVQDPNKCLICENGLVFKDNKCITECPPHQVKSSDGSVCEDRVYPLNIRYIPFPFCFTAAVLLAVSVISWLITQRTTLINQTFIVMLAILIHIMVFFEIIKGITDHQTTYVAVPIIILVIHLVLNVAFTLTFIFQVDDFQYTEYRDANRKLFAAIILLTIFFSFHIIRITWSKVFLINGFKGSAINPNEFIRPLTLFSRLHVLVVLIPLVLLNGIGASVAKVGWGTNQLQMTMVEICLLSVVFASCIAIEQFIQKPRTMLYKPSDESKLFSGMFAKTNIAAVSAIPEESDDEEKDSQVVGDSIFWPLKEKNNRFERLEEVIRAVKCYKDIKLNNCFDNIMDVEMGDLPGRRCDTDFEPEYPLPLEMELDQQLEKKRIMIPKNKELNKSFPGLNESYDGNLKRIELLEYFEKKAIEDAENERRFIDKLAKKNRTRDKEVMYDAELIDNCFFAPKSKADNVTQTINEMKEQGIDPMDLIPYTGKKEPDSPKIPNFDDTLLKSDKSIQVQPADLKSKLTDKADIPHSLEVGGFQDQLVNTVREHTKFGIESGEDELESFKSASSFNSGESQTSNETIACLDQVDQKSIYISEETLVDRKPDKEMWVRQADYLKTIILADIEIASKLKEPYKGLNVKNEQDYRGDDTEKTISGKKKKRRDLNDEPDQTNLSFNDAEKIEEPIEEEDYDQIDALFYKNNYPHDSNYTVSSIHTSELESIPADKSHKDDFTAWMRETVELNQRTFNVFEVLGNYKLDASGNIEDRDRTIIESNFLDRDGFQVNEKGYLINEVTGAIRSRFTYDDLFMPEVGTIEDLGELPMPYRLEKFNFNPHRIMGSFDYENGKPVFLKNKYNNLTDKHYRPVNQCGFLINEREDIIDSDGHVKFIRAQLTPKGNVPAMYPYKGEAFSVADIIGRFNKEHSSKDIILKFDRAKGRAIDEDGKLVNAVGYLIDEKGNIVNKQGQIKFNFWEILFNEPPKIFSFTEFSLNWIKGALDRDVTLNQMHNDEFDLMGRRINTMGYLINKEESIVDQHGKEVFKNEILTQYFGQDAKIPEIFRSGKLRKPLNWSNVQDQAWALPDDKKFSNFKASTDKQSNNETAMPSDYFSKEITPQTKKELSFLIDAIDDFNKNAQSCSSLSHQESLASQSPNQSHNQSPLNQIDLQISNFKLDLNTKLPLNRDETPQMSMQTMPMQTQEQLQVKKKRAKSSKHRLNEKPHRNQRPGLKVLQLYSQYLDGAQIAPNFNNTNQRSHQKLRNVPRLKRNNLMKMNDTYADQAEQIFANDGFDPLQLAEDILTRGKGRNNQSKTQMQQMNDAYGPYGRKK